MLKTEMRNPDTYGIERMSALEIVSVINQENNNVIKAIDETLPQIADACRSVENVIQNGGRVFYIGAGTSGRLGVIDAAECPPTFGVADNLFNGIIAGGKDCMFKAKENAEDNPDISIEDLKQEKFSRRDILIGISASGSAQYVISAIEFANSIGAKTVSITNNKDTLLGTIANINICADTGPEVITGSTRMKAGTAQKIILNMISTTAMIKCGCVYENLMINLKPTNKKLTERMVNIVSEILKCNSQRAEILLNENEWDIRKAIEEGKV